MILPPFLFEKDLVAIISPAGKIVSLFIEKAQKYLKTKHLKTVLSQYATDSYHQFASTDQNRATDLQMMINNPKIKAIWCSRGGYGTMRILDKIDFSFLEKNPKWLIGFSDITVLHSVLQEKHKIVSVHGSMCINLNNDNFSETGMDNLWKLLFGNIPIYEIPSYAFNRIGKAKGILIGGNLSLLCALMGSKYDFNPKGKILFIEDTGEYLYRLDRMMHSLKNSGKLANLSGLIVGQMTDMKDNEIPFGMSAYEIIANAVSDYRYPVMFNFPAGHSEQNEPLLLGASCEIDVSTNYSLLKFESTLKSPIILPQGSQSEDTKH